MAPRIRGSHSPPVSKRKASEVMVAASTSRHTRSKFARCTSPLHVVKLSVSPSRVQSPVPAAPLVQNPLPAMPPPLVAYSDSNSSAGLSDSSSTVSKTLNPSESAAPSPPVASVTSSDHSPAPIVPEPLTAPVDESPLPASAGASTSTLMSSFEIGSLSSQPPDLAQSASTASRTPSPSSPPPVKPE